MKSILLSICSVFLLVFTALAFAGGPERRPPPPAPEMHSGFYLGVGPSTNSIDVRYREPVIDGTTLQAFNNHENRLSPTFQFGYWGMLSSDWMWGLKVLYKYLNARLHLVYNDDEEFTVADKMYHEYATMLLFGAHIHSLFFYFGGGIVLFPLRDTIEEGSRVSSVHRNLWGGIAQLGMIYALTHACFLDFVYSYSHTGSKSFDTAAGPFRREVSVGNQQFTITLNRSFAQ